MNYKSLCTMLDKISDGACLVDNQAQVLYVNPTHDKFFGEGDGARVGDSYLDRLSKNDLKPQVWWNNVKNAIDRDGLWEGQISCQRGSGPFICSANVMKMEFYKQDVYVFIHSEVASAPTKFFWQESLDHMPVVFFAKSVSGRYLGVNSEFERLFNWERKNVIGKTDSQLFPKEVYEQLNRNDVEVVETRKPKVWIETVYDFMGRPRIYESYKFPYFDKEGKVYGVGGVAIEITEKKRAEEQLELSRKMLMRSARMAAVGEMAAGIAHEINNPMAVIHAHSQLISTLQENKELSNEVLVKSIKGIEEGMVRMQKIVKGLLSFAREASHDPMIETPIREIIGELAAICETRKRRENVEVSFPEVDPALKIQCRPYQVSQMLLNLLNNSFDAVSGVTKKWINVEFSDRGNSVEFKVTDSGNGIPPNQRDQIFNAFFTTKKSGFGSGLGLSISRGLAREHGGDLTLDEKAKYTTFVLTLLKQPMASVR